MAGHQPRSQLDVLDQSVNEVLVHVGKALRAQGKNGRKTVGALSAAKINESNILFNATLDGFETEILRAKAILRRDLELVRAKKSIAASVSAAAKQETPAPGVSSSFLNQAPPAAMDIDLVEPSPTTAGGAKVATKAKSEFGPDMSGNGISTKPAMAPFPNMDIDTPMAVPALPASAPMSASISNRSQGKQQANGKSPAVKKEALSRSPQHTTKPVPIPSRAAGIAGINGFGKAAAATKKAISPAATRVPSPTASRSTASPATSKVPSPVLVKSVASPAVKVPGPQPPAPTLYKATAGSGVNKTMPQSSSSSPSVTTTSPVLAKKAAATRTVSKPATPVPVPRIPTPATAPVVPPPAIVPPAAPVPSMEAPSTDANMDNFFDLTSPAGDNEPVSTDQGFTDMQFSLVPFGASEDPKQQKQRQKQQKQLNNKRSQPQQQQQALPPPQAQLQAQPQPQAAGLSTSSQNQSMDDFEFDVEKFATDAAQNLLTDNSFAAGPTNASQQPQPQTQTQTQPQVPADTAMSGVGSIDDDLFKFIDDGMEGLGDDTTTNFDELFLENPDSGDPDSFFDA